MLKLNNRGISLVEAMAASVILSFIILMISNNVNNMIRLNEVNASRIEAFNNAELLANHFTILDNPIVAEAMNPIGTEVSSYTLADCSDVNSPLRDILEDLSADASYCQSLFAPNYNNTYAEGEVVLYIFESLEENFTHIINGAYPPAITEYATNYNADYYSTGLTNYTVDNVVVVIYYSNNMYISFGEVMIYEK